MLESEETYDGSGFFPRENTFYQTQFVKMNHFDAGYIGGVFITLSSESVFHTRSIYSVLDYLGDVGGLLDMLRFVVQMLL